MYIGISDLAYSVRKNSAAAGVPVQLGHAQQLIAAALGYNSLAAYQAAQEPQHLNDVNNVVLDYDIIDRRAGELGAAPAPGQLHELIGEAFKARAPHVRVHTSHASFDAYVREHVARVVINDGDVISEMTCANYDGIDEVYFNFEIESETIPVLGALDIDLDGHVRLGIDTERPYSGHIVNVEGTLSVERLGRQCFGSVDCQVTKASLDTNWGDEYNDSEPPSRSVSEAYAELLGLEFHEVDDLADVEAIPLDGNSGEMVYGYLLDFTDYASPEVAKKILQRHASLCIEVSPSFFNNVRGNDWPR